jgi:hypothetical protein
VKQESRAAMATRLSRQMIMKLSLGAMLASLLLLGLFTWIYAPLLSPAGFVLSCITILVWVFFAWSMNVLRTLSQLSPRLLKPGSRLASFSVTTGGGLVALAVAVAALGWLFYAQGQPAGSIPQKSHWWGHALMLVATGFGLLKFFFVFKQSASEDTGMSVMENANKRDRLISEIRNVTASPWMQAFGSGSAGNRLRASLLWLEEEIRLSLPQHGFALAESSVTHFLDEQWRLLTFVKDLQERNEAGDNNLSEAERRVLESINKSGRIARKIAA